MSEERKDLIQKEEEVVDRIVHELLDDAASGNFNDISYFLGDAAHYIPESARHIQSLMRSGRLVVRVDEEIADMFTLSKNLEGDGATLTFGSSIIGIYLGMPPKGTDPESREKKMRLLFIKRLPEIASILS